MAHLTCTFSSEVLKMNTFLTVILPERAEMGKIRVIYLLHGLEDNCTGWGRYTAVERYAREHNAAVVIPEVQRSFYTDMAMGLPYFQYVSEEVPAVCRRFFGFSEKKEQNFIMGLSMGGYGAMKCLMRSPERYAGCAIFSAVTDIQKRVEIADPAEKREFQAIFGMDLTVPEEDNLLQLLQKVNPEKIPPIYSACGESDGLYEGNVRFAELLKERGIKVNFEHWEGNHDWLFWDKAVLRGITELFGIVH